MSQPSFQTDDLRISRIRPLIAPAILMDDMPESAEGAKLVSNARTAATNILQGTDDRLLAVVGPCSIHDPKSAIEYAHKLKPLADKLSDDLLIIMRVYFEKPRTTVGWKGLINDPNLDDSFDINEGLKVARRLLLDISDIGIASGTEFLDTISPQFVADLIAWGAIGARTTESQIHRELASGLSMPVGFKNGTGGSVQIAVDGIKAAANPHHFLSVTKQGVSAIVSTEGNNSCHAILRGSSNGTNFDKNSITSASDLLESNGLSRCLMVDCSHGNSCKDHTRQSSVADHLGEQVAGGSRDIVAVMVESHLTSGSQRLNSDRSKMLYGQSVTDACIGWDETEVLLENLAQCVSNRRSRG
ncbi:MAG: 3-deoxy-7-phosphoheptulonate synthase [Verrucomicrobiaceae bacterium]|nr:3-deoxy-7-phosphoheptulonate synthase [Verrucomicrobiaceae bacterium]